MSNKVNLTLLCLTLQLCVALGENVTSATPDSELITWTKQKTPVGQELHKRYARETTIHTCNSKSCTNGICTEKNYEGPNPPDWCRNLVPYKKQSSCSWTKECYEGQCYQTESKCDSDFEDATSRTTFNFDCGRITCVVRACTQNVCKAPEMMSKQEFEDKFTSRVPNCEDVENDRRKKRASGTAQSLLDHCCDIVARWGGTTSGSIRPRRRRSQG